MIGRLGDRLVGARRRRFVGREGEIELFRALFDGALLDAGGVLFLHGPGGIGKTALLDVLADVAAGAGAHVLRVDARQLTAPDALRDDLSGDRGGRLVLLIDTYELMAPLDAWVRDQVLADMPADAVVVIAGRHPPSPAWLADPAWRELLRVVSLRNLAPRDAAAYLEVEGVPQDHRERIIALSHGHPLTLSLLVDAGRRADPPRSLAEAPDLVRALLAHVVEEAPSARHRAALEVVAHARVTTEELLRDVLGEDDAGALFGWLRTLSFVEEGSRGLYPHDVARDVLDADLRWRDPAGYADLHRQVRAAGLARIRRAGEERERQQRIADALYASSAVSELGRYFTWAAIPARFVDEMRSDDEDTVLRMTVRHQGVAQADLVAHWMRRQPHAFRVFRGTDGLVHGYAAHLALHEATPADLAADPGARRMWGYAQRHGAPRPGEHVTAWRFFVDAEAHHGPSASRTLVSVWHVQDILTRERASWGFIGAYQDVTSSPSVMEQVDFARAAEADYEVDGRRYVVYAHDWRRVGVAEWLDRTADLELGASVSQPPDRGADFVLSQPEFVDAVRGALRDLHAPDRLAGNPLLRSRLVREQPEEPPAALQALLQQAAATLPEDLLRVVDRTFLRPAPTQERAADLLHLSFSTFRRHRDRAVQRIVDALWQRELHGDGHRLDTGRPPA